MWKRSGVLYSRCAQGRTVFSSSHKTANVSTKSINATTIENLDHVPKEARVVICGGGVMGGAVAYHLSLMGLGLETVLIESGR
jgi:NADPH-dependent 2,4-dienoyl-CoA reductase/sulfur reductase-like enzyme